MPGYKMTPKAARHIAGITQEDMAKLLCITQSTYSKYERDPGRFTVAQMWQFCRAVKMPMEEVFSDDWRYHK